MNEQTAEAKIKSTVKDRQDPLIASYHTFSNTAQITTRARTKGSISKSPFHGTVVLGCDEDGFVVPFGIHTAIGGYCDAPNPGDLLCGALAACIDSTTRIIAERSGIELVKLGVEVVGEIDVRGALLVARDVPVGFQKFNINVEIEAADGTNPIIVSKLIAAAENSCVMVQTLLSGCDVVLKIKD